MLWLVLAAVAVAGIYVLHQLLFVEKAPVVPESKVKVDSPLRTKKPKVEKKTDKTAKKDTHFDKPYRKEKDSDDEDNVKEDKVAPASPSSPAKTAFVAPVSKRAQNKAMRDGFVTIEKKARSGPTAEEVQKREELRKEEEAERKAKDEARKLRQKERAEREEKEKEKKKDESGEQSVKDFLEKQKKEKEAAKAARVGGGGKVKVFSSPEQNKTWEASTPQFAEGGADVDDESFPQLGK